MAWIEAGGTDGRLGMNIAWRHFAPAKAPRLEAGGAASGRGAGWAKSRLA